MAAALIFAVLPPALTTCLKNRGTVILVSSVCLYCACALYHAALGAYLCTAAYLLISELSSRKPINAVLRHAYALALPFVIGTGTFAAVSFFQNRFDSFHSHTAGALAMPSLSDMPAVIAGNSKHYYEILFNDWSASCFGWLFAACFALFVARTLLRWNSNRIRDGQRTTSPCAFRPFPRLAALLLLMFFLPLSIFGLQVCMQTPLWWPRYFQSFGFLPALCLLGVGRTGIRPAFARSVPEGSAGGAPVRPCPATKALYGKAVTALAGLVAAQLVLFADVYGNLSARQKEWEFLHISSLYFDLRKLIQDGQGKVIVYRGSIGHTPLLRVPASKFPVLFRLVHVYASDELNGYWSGKQMRVYGIAADRADSAPAASSLSLRTVNPAYTIETGPDGTAVVTFFPADKTPVPPEMPRPVPDRR
jgi:hypothetical protein